MKRRGLELVAILNGEVLQDLRPSANELLEEMAGEYVLDE